MRSIQITRYAAFDGVEFDTAAGCKAHEREHVEKRLVGLTAEQVAAAISRVDTDLADAIETVGERIRKARIESGILKRRRREAAGEGEGAARAAYDPAEPTEAAGDEGAAP